MRRLPRHALLFVVAGCAFDRGGVAPPDGFVDPTDDGGGVPSLWRDDTVEDFAAASAVFADATVEPWGAIGPAAWLTGGLVTRADDSRLFTSLGGDEWAALEASGDDGFGITRLIGRDYGFDGPRGMSLSSFESYTYWAWGEIWLDAGNHTFALTADDLGFLDLAPPASSEYTRVVVADYDTDGLGPYSAPVAGWYGLRLALSEDILDSGLSLRVQTPGAPAPAAISPERLRTRVDVLTGLRWDGFEDSRLLAPQDTLGPFLWRGDGIDYSPSNGDVDGLGFKENDRFSMRWSGQLRIDVAGTYRFRIESDDGHRLWIDGLPLLDAFLDSPQDSTTDAIDLDVGWHDLVFDVTDNTGPQRIRIRATESPDPTLTAEIPAERLRPAAPRQERTAGAVRGGAAIPDQGEVSLELAPGAPDGAFVDAVELGITITHDFWSELGVVVVAPDGSEHVAIAAGSIDASGTRTERIEVPVAGEDAAGTWAVKVQDDTALDGGTIEEVALTLRYRGGEPPIAPLAVYESPVEDLGAVVGFDTVTWTGRFPPGTSAEVRFRTCDDPAACADEDWSSAVGSGERPPVLGRRYAQYRLELASDGGAVPFVDALEITYRTEP